MVMLRSSVSDAVVSAHRRRGSLSISLLDKSVDFLSLETLGKRRRTCTSGGGRGPVHSNGGFCDKEESYNKHTLRSLRKRPGIGQHSDSSFDKHIEMQNENSERKHFTRQLAKLQANIQKNGDCKEDEVAPVTRLLRRTRNAEKAAVNPHTENGDVEVRRSCRIRRSRYSTTNQSVLFDKLITNTAEAVLQKMDDMKKMRRLRMRELDDPGDLNDTEEENLEIYSRVKKKREAQQTDEETTDNQDESGESSEEVEDHDDEDGEEDNQKRYDFRQRKAVVRYQAPLKEPRQQRKQKMFYSEPASPVRRRYPFTSATPRSPYRKRRINRRRHAIHNSDSTSSSSSDDEQCFERRRNLNRSKVLSRCLPLNLRREDLKGIHKDRMKIGASLADVDPMQMDSSVRFDSVGGLSSHIAALKEMVVFPLLYPEVFERFKIQPPRGCLFYGPPGTGKTLVARALANECSQGDRRVAFFMRKGADCLSKWVGESERQLRLLFDQAYQMRPSIIFFDEIDGLAPVRSSRQDQIHSSIVSTLLALMDGLDSRGEIVVIGATNRLDSIDPALRRPGRFDREFLFSLPDKDARKEILKIHMQDWNPKPLDSFVEELGEKCVGYCGADIKFVCTEAALCALRRRYPQIYTSSEKLQLDVSSINITAKDFVVAMQKIVPASQRAVVSPGQALSFVIKPLLQNTLNKILGVLQRVFPHAEQSIEGGEKSGQIFESDLYSDDEGPTVFENGLHQNTTNKQKENMPFLQFNRHAYQQPISYRPRLLITGEPGMGQSSHLAPAVLHALEKFTVYTLDLAILFGVSVTSPEETCAQLFHEAKRTAPSILYIPHIHLWWETVGCTLKATFITLMKNIPSFTPILLLATCDVRHEDLPEEVQELFVSDYEEVFHVHPPSHEERRMFFEDLILNQASKPPASKKKAVLQALEVLPVVPPPEPRQLTTEELKRLEEQEEDTLRELRLFLRDVTHRLAVDKRFRAFTKPVDPEEVPDYITVIAQPMDLSTVISKIDLHKYQTVKDYLKDIDLICSNALEYNPDRDPADRLIRHRACTLRDSAYAIIKAELDEDFEKNCEEIQTSRKKRGCFSSKYVPSYYYVLPKHSASECKKLETEHSEKLKISAMPVAASTPSTAKKRYRRKSRWSAGTIAKKKKMAQTYKDNKIEEGDEAESDGVESLENQDSSMDQTEIEVNGDSSVEAELKNVLEILTSSSESNPKATKEDDVLNSSVDFLKNCAMIEAASSESFRKETEVDSRESSNFQMENIPQNGDAKDMCIFRMTRAKHSQVEQQHFINVEKAMEILSEPTPLFYVDQQQLKNLLKRVTGKSQGYNVFHLEKLYALLSQCIYRHRKDYDKTQLAQEMEREMKSFKVFA